MKVRKIDRPIIRIGAFLFEIVKTAEGQNAVFGYVSRDRFAVIDGSAIRASGASLEERLDDSETHVIIADHFVAHREPEFLDRAISGIGLGALVALGDKYFSVRIFESGEPMIFKKIVSGAYVLLHHGRSGTPRTLCEIADDFGLVPRRSAFIFARLLGVSD